MYKVRTYNQISIKGLDRFPRQAYEVGSDIAHPDAFLLRSQKLQGVEVPASLLAVARAGAGVNNVPVAEYSQAGHRRLQHPGRQRQRRQGTGDGRHAVERARHHRRHELRAVAGRASRMRRKCRRWSKKPRRASPATRFAARRSGSSVSGRSARWSPTWRWRWA
jgi:hypothetical protein